MRKLALAMTFFVMVCLMMIVSCRKPVIGDINPDQTRFVTFNATTQETTKAYIDGNLVKWKEGDQISVNGETMTLSSGAGTISGKFSGKVSGSDFYVGYPVEATTYHSPGSLTLNVPSRVTYNTEAPTEGLMRMVAHTTGSSDNLNLNFKNAVNVLKLPLKGDGTEASNLVSIVLSGTDSNINGDINVTFSGDNVSFGYATTNASKKTTISFGTGLQLTADKITYVYVVLPKISGGDMTMRFYCSNNKYMQKKAAMSEMFNEVGNILSPKEFTVEATIPVLTINEVTTLSGCVDCKYTFGGTVKLPVGGEQYCEAGMVYTENMDVEPTIDDTENCDKIVGAADIFPEGITQFNVDQTDFVSGHTYKIRAYAIDENGYVKYGSVKTFTGGDWPHDLPSEWTDGTVPSLFSVESGKYVKFSQGNLQYVTTGRHNVRDGGTAKGTWRFADHQFDVMGSDNNHTSSEYTGWIDLFGWATSGCSVSPYTTITGGENYGPGYSIAGRDYDWGVYNDISNDGELGTNAWRTLESVEWGYLLGSASPCRDNATNLYAEGMVSCVPGIILLPDNWEWKGDVASFEETWNTYPGQSQWKNEYTYSDWAKMEAAGAVFLPAAGLRTSTYTNGTGNSGYYWSTTNNGVDMARSLWFTSNLVVPQNHTDNKSYGQSVRLVRNVE